MTTEKKTTTKNQKEIVIKKNEKEETREESRFYIVRTAQEARESLQNRVEDYKEKYVKKQIESGRTFISELKEDPLKRLDGLINDGQEAVKELKNDVRKKYDAVVDESKTVVEDVKKGPFKASGKFIGTMKSDTRKTIEKTNDFRKKIYHGIEGDVRLAVDDVVKKGKKTLDAFPMKKTIEKKINSSLEVIPSRLNLLGKEEVDSLKSCIDGLNKKVDALNKQYANV